MTMPLIFLVALLGVVVALNWRLVAARLGFRVKPCEWHRLHERDRDGRCAWFCPACGREELIDNSAPPPDCGARIRC